MIAHGSGTTAARCEPSKAAPAPPPVAAGAVSTRALPWRWRWPRASGRPLAGLPADSASARAADSGPLGLLLLTDPRDPVGHGPARRDADPRFPAAGRAGALLRDRQLGDVGTARLRTVRRRGHGAGRPGWRWRSARRSAVQWMAAGKLTFIPEVALPPPAAAPGGPHPPQRPGRRAGPPAAVCPGAAPVRLAGACAGIERGFVTVAARSRWWAC